MEQFVSFPKIHRLSREMVVTEKIDGSNAQIYIGAAGELRVGSRERWLTPEADNAGFAAWAHERRSELLDLGPGIHFGEWWGAGIQRGYGLNERRFSLLDALRWAPTGGELKRVPMPNPKEVVWQRHAPACCSVVPILYSGLFETDVVEQVVGDLRVHGSRVVPGYLRAEGVVVLHVASGVMFKKLLERDELPKGAGGGG